MSKRSDLHIKYAAPGFRSVRAICVNVKVHILFMFAPIIYMHSSPHQHQHQMRFIKSIRMELRELRPF